ncbi:MAG: DUF445 domain-containing protein [Acidimicrobiales bacterium]|jgi:uncharacterized membrane-anchored protein YjiN (DUF445 family)|nr:DUF445 domain-containing protein [Acidimicrobiales bacterium]
MTSTLAAPPPVRSQELRRERLVVMRRRATMLLTAVTAVFLGVTVLGGDATWVGYVQATAEAAMVGGLADWFAVVALFRHPLGIPIPHTAVIVERKDQFGATLGEFVQEAFLTPETISARVRAAGVAARTAAWLRDPDHAARVAGEVLDGAVGLADLVRDEDVHRVLEQTVRERLDAVPLAPLAGRTLALVIRDGRHQQVLDVALRGLDRYLDDHRDELRERLGTSSPWWLPGAAEDRIFERLLAGARTLIAEMLEDHGHHLRVEFETRLVALARDLQTSPGYRLRGEELKHELLEQPQVRELVASLWSDAKRTLRGQAADPGSALRRQLASGIGAVGARLAEDPVLAAKLEDGLVRGVSHVAARFQGEIGELVRGTIERWDAEETAERLELLLGPDLQFIRINGTVVGALAGLTLHTVAELLA